MPSLDGTDLTNFKVSCEITSIFNVIVDKKSMESTSKGKKLRHGFLRFPSCLSATGNNYESCLLGLRSFPRNKI